MAHLSIDLANKVFDLLVADYGAQERHRRSFVAYFANKSDFSQEFRFEGIFGGGGKIRLDSHYGLFATYYPESATPEREQKIRILNDQLRDIWNNSPIGQISLA